MRPKSCWLSNFNKEDINADFKHPGKRIYKKVMGTKKLKGSGKEIPYDVHKKDCEDRNNKRNNDVFTVAKANKYLQDEIVGQIELDKDRASNDIEDAIIEWLDAKLGNTEES